MNKGFVFLVILTLAVSGAFANSVRVYAQSTVETFAFISVEPNPALANQDTVYVSIRVEPAPPTPDDKFQRIAVTVTRPDGVIAINYYDSNADGTLQFSTYSNPSMVGDWILKVSFGGQAFANNTIYYLPSENQTTFTRLPSPSPTPPPWSTTGSWATKAPMRLARGGLGVAVVDEKIYAIGGSTARGGGGTQSGPLPKTGGTVGTNEEYDPATDTWTYKASMPTPRAYFAIAVCQDKIYCLSNGVNEVYDPVTDSWETKTPLPIALDVMQANVLDDKIYLIGYVSGNSSSSGSRMPLTKVYDPATDSWITKAHMPIPMTAYVSIVLDDKIYVMGGLFTYPSSNINQIYDPKTDSWSQGAPLPTGDMYGAIAVATTGELAPKRTYVISGAAASNQIYDPATDSWANGADLPTLRLNFGIGVVKDTFYVIGGQVFTYPSIFSNPYGPSVTPYATNEQYTPAGYGTPDPTYQTPTPSPSPSHPPTRQPTLTPTLLPSVTPTPSALPSASEQPTQTPMAEQTFPTELIYAIAITGVFLVVIIAAAVLFRRLK